MRDTFTSANARDFNSRYVQSYGYYVDEKNDKKIPVYLKSIDGDTLYFSDLNGTEFNTRADRGTVFEFFQMTRKIYMGVNGLLYYISRRPQRQWQRGVSDANTYVILLTDSGPMQGSVTSKLMQQIMFGEGLPTSKGTMKLSDQFAICGKIVYLYYYAIGTYDENTKTVRITEQYKSFYPELSEICEAKKIGVTYA